ncbi:hypothetical protein BDW66DRAFT_123852 [Aspergillus desertorum]
MFETLLSSSTCHCHAGGQQTTRPESDSGSESNGQDTCASLSVLRPVRSWQLPVSKSRRPLRDEIRREIARMFNNPWRLYLHCQSFGTTVIKRPGITSTDSFLNGESRRYYAQLAHLMGDTNSNRWIGHIVRSHLLHHVFVFNGPAGFPAKPGTYGAPGWPG